MLAWAAIGIVALIVLVVLAITYALHSPRVHEYALRTVQEKATAALGTEVRMQNFALNFTGISPTIDAFGVTVAGAPPFGNTQLLQVEHARVGIRVLSVLGRKWYLSDVEVHHPVVQVFVDKDGRDNLPKPQSNDNSKSNTDLFDLGVRHAVLDRGEIYYNNNRSVLSADLHDLNVQTSFNTSQQRYSGTLAYRDGHLVSGTFNPIPHDLSARFDATRGQFNLESAELRSGNSRVALTATVANFNEPRAHATYDANIDAGEFRRILKNPTLPLGVIKMTGTVDYNSQPNVPLLSLAVLQGELNSTLLQLRTPSLTTEVRDLRARYELKDGNANVSELRASVLGGLLAGSASIRDITGNSRSKVNATLKGAQVASVKSLLNSPALRDVNFSGTLNVDVNADWGKTLDDLTARANATVDANAANAASGAPKGSVPLNGVIHANYEARTKQITLTNSAIRTPKTTIDLNGTVSDRSALLVRLQANDLHELETIANIFSTPTPDKPSEPLGLFGTAQFNGQVTGSTAAPHITGQLAADNVRVHGSAWRSLRTQVDASPTTASLKNGELRPAGQGNVKFSLAAGLKKWAFTPNSPVQVSLEASKLDVGELAKAAGVKAPSKGILDAHIQASGTQLSPVGNGEINVTRGSFVGEPFDLINVMFNGTGDAVHMNANVSLPAGKGNAVLTYMPKTQGYEVQVRADNIKLEKIMKASSLQLTGLATLHADGRGTLKDPGLTANLSIPSLHVQDQTIGNISFQTDVGNHVANFALDAAVLNTPIKGRGTLSLVGDYQVNATLDTPRIAIQPILATYMPEQAQNIKGEIELHATMRGPAKDTNRLEAHVTVPVFAMNYQDRIQISAPTPLQADFTNGVLNLRRASLKGTGTDVQFQATVPIADKNAPASLLALGTINLQLIQLFDPEVASSGQIKFDINSYGQRSDPNVQGQVQIVNASLATGDAPVGLSNGNGVLTLTKDRLIISSFKGNVGSGTMSASGGVLYRPSLQFNVALEGNNIRMLLPAGIRTGVSTNLNYTGTLESSALRGQVNIDQLSFAPDFDIAGALGEFGGTSTPPPSQGFTNNVQLDMAVRSTNGINLVSRELTLQGTANLNVRGTAADPVITGRVNVNNGDLVFRGNRYLLQNGTIDFMNPTRTEPVLNASISTTIQQYNINMHLEGPVDRLRTSYNSDPALPPSDIINLLAFGKTTESAAANPAPPGTLGAQSVLASAVSGQVTSRLQKIAGISQLSVDPVLGGNQKNPGANVTIQQRVTGKIFVTFSTDVTGTQRDVVQLQYQKSPRVSFSGTRDQNGGFGFDVRIRRNW